MKTKRTMCWRLLFAPLAALILSALPAYGQSTPHWKTWVKGPGATFVMGTICTYTVQPSEYKGPRATSDFTVAVTPNNGACSWSVENLPTWITVKQKTSTSVTLTVKMSYVRAARSAEITVAGHKVVVYQEGTDAAKWSCYSEYEFDWRGGYTLDGIVVVSGTSSVSWTVTSDSDWFQVVGGCSGSVAANSSGEVTLWLDPNTTGSTRSSWMALGGKWVRITQTSN